MNTLPHSIIKHIFGFILQPYEMNLLNKTNLELEYVKILENKRKNHINLLKEFKAKTTFWRVKWLNKNLDLGSSGDEEENPGPRKYESTRAQLDFITTYWNYHYPAYFANTALATTGPINGVPISPIPAGDSWLSMKCILILGVSLSFIIG